MPEPEGGSEPLSPASQFWGAFENIKSSFLDQVSLIRAQIIHKWHLVEEGH